MGYFYINIAKEPSMQTANVYITQQTIEVQVAGDFNVRTRYHQLYSPNIKLYRNIPNPIRFLCKNQDQKPVAITGFELLVNLVDAYDEHIVQSWVATVVNSAKGIASVTIDPATLSVIENRKYYFTIAKRINGTDTQPAYIDDHYSVRLPVELLDGYVSPNLEELDLGAVDDTNEINLVDLGTL